jgi:hypothetical protein
MEEGLGGNLELIVTGSLPYSQISAYFAAAEIQYWRAMV